MFYFLLVFKHLSSSCVVTLSRAFPQMLNRIGASGRVCLVQKSREEFSAHLHYVQNFLWVCTNRLYHISAFLFPPWSYWVFFSEVGVKILGRIILHCRYLIFFSLQDGTLIRCSSIYWIFFLHLLIIWFFSFDSCDEFLQLIFE